MKKLLYALGVTLLLIFSIQTAHASTFPSGCTATTAFSSTTGHPCTETLPDCNVGDLFSAVTGRPCTQQTYLPGCTSLIGYSVTTGSKCDGSTPLQQISQQLNQIIQNTSPATPTPPVTPPTPSFTIQNMYTPENLYYGKGNTNTMISAEIYGTNLKGLVATWSIDGTVTASGNNPQTVTDKMIGQSADQQGVFNGYYYAYFEYQALDLSDGPHTATITVGGQTQSLTFTIAPNSQSN